MKDRTFKFQPIEKKPLVVELTHRLMDYIFSDSIRPGDKLPAERQLSEELDVGRSAIREAIKALTVLGILEVRQGDGTYLRKADSGILSKSIEWGLFLGERRAMDLVEARKEIEIISARMAAERATDSEIKELYEILLTMKHASVEEFPESDISFHMKLIEMAKNMVIKDIHVSIHSLLRTWVNAVIESAGRTDFSYDDHLKIYNAIEQRDPIQAVEAMESHMEDATKRLIDVIGESEQKTTAVEPLET